MVKICNNKDCPDQRYEGKYNFCRACGKPLVDKKWFQVSRKYHRICRNKNCSNCEFVRGKWCGDCGEINWYSPFCGF